MNQLLEMWSGSSRLKSPRGIAATVITVLVVVVALASKTSVGTLVILALVVWWLVWWSAGFMGNAWHGLIAGTPPKVSAGRAWQSNAARPQLREDRNARIFDDRGGILLQRRTWFIATGTPPIRLVEGEYQLAANAQDWDPQLIAAYRDRVYWWYDDAFYWTTNADYSGQDVKALLFARQRQRERELEHAHALLGAANSPAARKREPPSRDVKLAVWKRDEGRCIECGSDFDLQYDHIIPFSMGGANTVENLQLLCGRCNQQKGGRL